MRPHSILILVPILIVAFWASTALAINCGQFTVCLDVGSSGTTVKLSINVLTGVLGGALQDVDTSGYIVNRDTAAGGALVAPGSPSTASTFSYTWTGLTTGTGDLVIGFPAVRVYGPGTTHMCYVSFRQEPIVDTGFSQCFTQNLQKSTKIDFALVVDDTGSMRNDIMAVVNNANGILDALHSSSSSFRSALVTYNDPTSEIRQTFVPGVADVKAKLAALKVSGGGDRDECMYDGLHEAMLLFWDETAVRMTLTMGDAPAKACTHTLQDVLDLASAFDVTVDLSPSTRLAADVPLSVRTTRKINIKVPVKKLNKVTTVPIRTRLTSTFEQISEKTGGKTIKASSTADVVPSIITAITGKPAVDPTPSPSPFATTKDLHVSRKCPNPAGAVSIAIKNPNNFHVPYEYRELMTRSRGKGMAPPGESVLEMKKKSMSDRVIFTIQWAKKKNGKPAGRGRKFVRSNGC